MSEFLFMSGSTFIRPLAQSPRRLKFIRADSTSSRGESSHGEVKGGRGGSENFTTT